MYKYAASDKFIVLRKLYAYLRDQLCKPHNLPILLKTSLKSNKILFIGAKEWFFNFITSFSKFGNSVIAVKGKCLSIVKCI